MSHEWINHCIANNLESFFSLIFFLFDFFSLVTYQWYVANSNLLYVKLNCSCIHLFIYLFPMVSRFYSQKLLEFIFLRIYDLSTDTFIYWKVLMHMLKLWTFGRANLWLENVWYTMNITIQGVLRILDVIIEYLTVNWISGKLVKNWCIASFHWELSRDCF